MAMNISADEKIDVKQALSAIHRITSEGKKMDDGYHLNGLVASYSFDGYIAMLSNDYVTLEIFFHNKFALEATSDIEKQNFFEKIRVISNK
jgi:hypothetical protein